jgi:phosphoserine phosphatase
MASGSRLIVSLQGSDVPGICSELAAVVAESQAQLIDMRQVVVRGRLRLALELLIDGNTDGIFLGIVRACKRFNLTVEFDSPDPAANGLHADESTVAAARPTSYVLTLLSEGDIGPLFLQQTASTLAQRLFSVEKVTRLSSKSMRCLELVFSTTQTVGSAEIGELRRDLYALGTESAVDVALQADTVLRRAKRIVVMDMDSTLIQQEVIDELARYAGVFEEVQAITHRAMCGELDFNQSLEQRCQLLKGTPSTVFEKVIANLVYTQGAHTLCRSLKKLGYRLAVISGGFRRVAQHVAQELGLDMFYANELEVDAAGCFTGRTVGPIVNAQRKADLLLTIAQKEGVTLAQTAAVGDGSNDLPMLSRAGIGIAFNAKPAVQKAASFRINQRNLDSILYLLGFSEDEQAELAGKGRPL